MTARLAEGARGLFGRRPTQRPADFNEITRAHDLLQPVLGILESPGPAAPRGSRQRARQRRAADPRVRAFNSSAAMLCAFLNGSPSSRTSVSASSVSVVPPSPARAARRATSKSASRIVAATSVIVRVASRNIEATSGCRSSSVSTMSPKGVLWTVSEDGLRLPNRLAANGARVLERHGIALLRHDAARLHEPFAEAQIAELHRAPQQKVLQHAADADEHDGRGRHALEQVVDGGDAAVGVAGRTGEAKQLARAVAIDGKTGSGNCARAERVAIGRVVRGGKPVVSRSSCSITASK